MTLKQFTIAASHTFNLGSYESFRAEVSHTYEVPVEDQDDPRQWPENWRQMRAEALDALNAHLRETINAQRLKRKNGDAKGA